MFLKSIFNFTKCSVTVLVIIIYIHYFIPQSWGFYTVDPKQPLYDIYRVRNGIADSTPLIKNNMSYSMGLSLKGKVLFAELYSIINRNNIIWKPLSADSLDYIIQHSSHVQIISRSDAKFKGHFLITKTDRPSYILLKNAQTMHPAKSYILADIQ